jgi:hypothetical protein
MSLGLKEVVVAPFNSAGRHDCLLLSSKRNLMHVAKCKRLTGLKLFVRKPSFVFQA